LARADQLSHRGAVAVSIEVGDLLDRLRVVGDSVGGGDRRSARSRTGV